MNHPALDRALAVLNNPETREHIVAWLSDRGEISDLAAAVQEQVESRADTVTASFGSWLTATVPAIYQDADLTNLRPEQKPDLVRGWFTSNARNLVLAGNPGAGKTHAAYALLIEAAALALVEGYSPSACPAAFTLAGLLDELRPAADSTEHVWERVKSTPLLLLDDMARTRPTEWASERVWMLINHRTVNNLRTVITTNATSAALAETWGDGTVDRLRDRSRLVTVVGESQRRTW